ncbi:MAG: prepilin-type N-terminal cleavage/methylation domain-containing protein [Patescibacteria group bacterium]
MTGFTLVELLVVISIIGLLTVASTVLISTARQKSRDARRQADLRQVYKALNMYLNEVISGGQYPNTGGAFYCLDNSSSGIRLALITNSGVLVAIPEDPLTDNRTTVASGCYAYRSNGQDFKLMILLETDDSSMENDGGTTDLRYEIFTPGAQVWTN